MNIKINWKLLVVILISTIACLGGFYIHKFIDAEDVVYTSLYYIPVIITGLWYYRCVIPLALTFAVYYNLLDLLQNKIGQYCKRNSPLLQQLIPYFCKK